MSRYIDAYAVCEMLEPFEDALDDEKVRSAYIQTLTLIHNAPSIDIVRCKECNYYVGCHCESEEMWGSIYGEIAGCEYMVREPDDFCSYGERK